MITITVYCLQIVLNIYRMHAPYGDPCQFQSIKSPVHTTFRSKRGEALFKKFSNKAPSALRRIAHEIEIAAGTRSELWRSLFKTPIA